MKGEIVMICPMCHSNHLIIRTVGVKTTKEYKLFKLLGLNKTSKFKIKFKQVAYCENCCCCCEI